MRMKQLFVPVTLIGAYIVGTTSTGAAVISSK